MYKNKIMPYLLIMPMLVFIGLFLIYPFTKNIFDSFFEYKHVLDTSPKFVGWNNYSDLMHDKLFQTSIMNTFILIALVIVFQVGTALVLALLVNSIKRFQTFYKVTFFMPIVISATALALMFNMFYNYDFGLINQALDIVIGKKILLMDTSKLPQIYVFLTLPIIWQYVGFYFVIFLTGLTTISDELLEAADIDGCTGIKKTLKIKIPLLQNVTRVVLTLAITGTLKVFDLPFLMATKGFPKGKMYFLGTYIDEVGRKNIGMGAAFAVVLVAIGVILSACSNLVLRQNKDI